jgi:hypothetical protein
VYDDGMKKVKIDILGTIGDTTKQILGILLIMAVILSVIGCMIAPWFGFIFEDYLKTKYTGPAGFPQMDIVNRKMIPVKIFLWTIAIMAWALVICSNINR